MELPIVNKSAVDRLDDPATPLGLRQIGGNAVVTGGLCS
jgi:hypothetical protein